MSSPPSEPVSTDGPRPAAPGGVWAWIGSPLVLGLALGLLSLPPILLFHDLAIWVALLATCVYPIASAPFVAARRSWWLGALLSTVVFFVLFSSLIGVVDAVRHVGEDG